MAPRSEPAMSSTERVLPSFRRARVPWMLLWIALTLGMFVPWWLYRQTRVINAHCKTFRIPELLVHIGVVSWVVYTVLALFNQAGNPTATLPTTVPLAVQIAGFAANVVMLAWTLFVRIGINALSGAKLGERHWVSFPLTLLSALFLPVAPLYLQYKINLNLDARRTA